jgi:hypothetical protein
MANLITGTSANFIPEVWSKKLLINFYKTTVLEQICNTDYEGEISGQGSKVIIRHTPTVGISDYDPMSATPISSYDDLGESTTELNIDNAKMFSFKVDDVLRAQADVELVNNATRDAGEKMKIALDTQVLAGIAGSAGTVLDDGSGGGVVITKANIIDMIVDLGTALDEKNIPETGRWIVIPAWMAGMIKKSDLKNANEAGDSTSIARNGRLGIIDRFTLYQSNSVPEAGGDFSVLAGTNAYATFASQFVKTETLRLHDRFGDAVRGLKVFGYKVVQPDAGALLLAKKA